MAKSKLLCCSVNIIFLTKNSFVRFGRFGLYVVQRMSLKRIQLLVGLLLKLPILITQQPNSDCNFETEQKYLLQLHHNAEFKFLATLIFLELLAPPICPLCSFASDLLTVLRVKTKRFDDTVLFSPILYLPTPHLVSCIRSFLR